MNNIIILLSVVLVVIIFYLIYKNYLTSSSKLADLTNLNLSSTTIPISGATIKGESANVSYSLWVYVNSWNNSKEKSIAYRVNDFNLYLDETTPTLILRTTVPLNPEVPLLNETGSSVVNNAISIPITSNFPIQKWVCIIISFDGRGFVDIYLDGKLVKSVQTSARSGLPDNNTGITVGRIQSDTYISNFHRHEFVMDPQTAWNTYSNGAGIPGLNYLIPSYGANITLLKDNVPASTITLF